MDSNQPTSLSLGDRIGRCRIIRFLAGGGMGEVYLAHDEMLEREVAVKVLPLHMADDNLVERFMKEAQLCSQISHPNVVTIHDFGRDGHLHYLVMQYIDGSELQTIANEQGGFLPCMVALRLIRPVAKGLHAVHEHKRGLIHRDIKPSNIMVGRDGQVYLMDFGLVREESRSWLTSTGKALGTPVYMSPEQSRVETLDRRSDIYSLGGTLYSLLTGQKPARGRNQVEVMDQIRSGARIPTVSELRPEIPREVSDLVQRAMAFRKEDRFPNALAMAQQMSNLLRSLHAGLSNDSLVPPLVTTRRIEPVPGHIVELVPELLHFEFRKRAWVIGGALLAVVLTAVISGLLSAPTEPDPPAITEGMVFIEAGDVEMVGDGKRIWEFIQERVPTAVSLIIDPPRTAHVEGFWIDRYEVTRKEYSEFLKATGHALPKGWNGPDPDPSREDHPVVNVTYADAEAYAEWAGKKLPTEEQWIRAFRGDTDWHFPWGFHYDKTLANVAENPKYSETSPITATPKDVSPFGVYNLVGNAAEFIRATEPGENDPVTVTKGSDWNSLGSIYGMGWKTVSYADENTREPILGFRCVVEEE